jgi:hypothetical protein
MRFIAIVVLSLIVIVAAVYFLIFSTCAITGSGLESRLSLGERVQAGVAAAAALAALVGLIRLIRKLNREM